MANIVELPRDQKFSNCCHKEKVIFPEDPLYPVELKNLVIGTITSTKKFFKSIRSYNNAIAFTSFGATFDNLFSQGPSVIRICGQIYHNTYALHPNEGDLRKFSQLYIIDMSMPTDCV